MPVKQNNAAVSNEISKPLSAGVGRETSVTV